MLSFSHNLQSTNIFFAYFCRFHTVPPRTSSKRAKASLQDESSSSSSAHRFRSPKHEERFARFYSGRKVIREKGFMLNPRSWEEITTYIQEQLWHKLCEPHCTSCPVIVKEFYVNAQDILGGKPTWKSWVRRKEVSFSIKDIEEYYGIDNDPSQLEYEICMNQKESEDMQRRVLTKICRE